MFESLCFLARCIETLSSSAVTDSRNPRRRKSPAMAFVDELSFDDSPKKRRRLTSSWDVLPSGHTVQQALDFIVQFGENLERDGNGAAAPLSVEFSSECVVSSFLSLKYNEEQPRHYPSPPWSSDDKEGHYVFALGDNLTPRYKIVSKIGQGTFGQVLECWDRKLKDLVAIKVSRGLQKDREEAQMEIDVLREVGKHDKDGKRCVQMREWFDYRNHTCIVFEKLGPSLYDYLRKNNYRPFPIDLVREIGRQLLESVAYMHDMKLVHTDLKPENILFVSSDFVKVPACKKGLKSSSKDDLMRLPKLSAIKLIDFGSATFEDDDHTSIISTRHYRAPEVILGLGWNYPCDIWSLGCILVELCTGECLFQTHENLEHLAMMERVFGPLPRQMIRKIDHRYAKYFRHGRRLDWPEGASSRESIRAVSKLSSLRNLILQHVGRSDDLVDLLQGLLQFEPLDRLTASEALRHPFFVENYVSTRMEIVQDNVDDSTKRKQLLRPS